MTKETLIYFQMSTIQREIGLSLYRWATGRMRSKLVGSMADQQMFPAFVLFYHRIATHSLNDWSIGKKNFERHLDWVSKRMLMVSLDKIRESQLEGRRSKPMVAITIDDGYAENSEHAIPALVERNIPCHYFVSTYFVETGEPFPHDLSRGLPLRPNSIEELQRFAEMGVEIGAHSHTHVNFGRQLSDAELRLEITDVRKRLQDWTGQSIDYFAFPYGLKQNISQQAIDVIFESGFKCFLSAAGGVNWPGKEASHLQRIHGDPGMAALKNWLTYDPRKIHASTPFEYAFRTTKPQSALAQ